MICLIPALQLAFGLLLLHHTQYVRAQFFPNDPTNVLARALGPRTIRVSWRHTSDFINPADGFRIRISSPGVSDRVIQINDDDAREFTVDNLVPYDYESSTGVQFTVRVLAYNGGVDSSVRIASPAPLQLPMCPGVCDYRRFTTDSCSNTNCVCNPSHTGTNCAMPTFIPGNVEVVFTNPVDADTPTLTVKHDPPALSTLDGRLVNWFEVVVYTLRSTGPEVLINTTFTPRPGRNSNAIADTLLSATYIVFNYAVTVRTVTDVPEDDNAVSPEFRINTHVARIVLNLVATATSPTSLTASWDPPSDDDGFVTGYMVTLSSASSGTSAQIISGTSTTYTNLIMNTTYTVSVAAINSVGTGASRTVTATTSSCGMNEYFSNGQCVNCPANSVSMEGSASINDCLCNPGFEMESQTCSACDVGTFKATLGNSDCIACSDLMTTTTTTSVFCDVCRFSEGSGPCYYFNTTLPFFLTNRESNFDGIFLVSWPDVPAQVTSFDRSGVLAPRTFTTSRMRVNITSTGRGVVAPDFSYFRESNFSPRNNSFFEPDGLAQLAEFVCTMELAADISSQREYGAPTTATILTLPAPLSSTNSALPVISSNSSLDAGTLSTATLHISYSMDTRLVDFVLNFTVVYTYSGDSTVRSQSFPPSGEAQGVLSVTGVFTDTMVTVYLETQLGSSEETAATYTSNMVNEFTPSVPTQTTTPIGTTVSDTTQVDSTTPTPSFTDSTTSSDTTQVESTTRTDSTTHTPTDSTTPSDNTPIDTTSPDGTDIASTIPSGTETPDTMVLGPAENISIVESADFVTISWRPPSTSDGTTITGYTVTVISEGQIQTVSIDSGTLNTALSRPSGAYSVTVQAIGFRQPSTTSRTTTTEEVLSTEATNPPLTLIYIVAGAAGGGALIVCVVIILVTICCCVSCSKRKKKSDTLLRSNSYVKDPASSGWKRPPAPLPMQEGVGAKGDFPLGYVNPGAMEGGTVPQEYTEMMPPEPYCEMVSSQKQPEPYCEMAGQTGAQEEYAEVLPADKRRTREFSEPPVIPSAIKKEAKPEDYKNEELYMEMAKIYFEDPNCNNSLAPFEIDRSRINIMKEIGKGEFGRVMKASAEHVIPGQRKSIVAVKMLKDNADEKTKKDFLGEAQLLAKFGSHPNVMGLLKVVCQSSPQLVIISYMPHGDLKHYLRKCASAEEKNYSIHTVDQVYIGQQIAAGMEYLASKFFIHRDLAARNVLVGEKNAVKISDFGLSRTLAKDDSYYKLSHTLKLPVKWMALESLIYQKFSTYSDVWSFGVVLWEIFSFGKSPFKGIKGMHISRHIQNGGRLACPEDCPKEVYELMKDCWKIEMEERPTFTQLKIKLKALSIKLKRATMTNETQTEVAEL